MKVLNGDKKVYEVLEELKIKFDYFEHPPLPNIEIAKKYWRGINTTKCKNLFFRNHKGNRHYLVIIEHTKDLAIKDMEKLLKQGKLTLASEKRLDKYLKIKPGSVSPFGLIHDTDNHIFVFIDENLKDAEKVSFHPNLNTASLVISKNDFIKYMNWTGNEYKFIELY
ncbi:prolyl-tRNA synthetase associated domain-containing protein [Bacteroidota bacterium]